MPKYHKRPDGLYETTRTDPRTKKRIHFYGTSAREVDRKIMEYETACEKGRSFKEVAEEWHDQHWPTLSPTTRRGYDAAYNRALAEFGSTPVKEIRPLDIKRFITEFSRGGRSKKTVTTQLLVLRMACAYAVQEGDTDHSPCDHIKVSSSLPKSYRQAATPEDEQRIRDNVGVWLFPFLILYTGLRKGEALALRREDFDFKASEIHISKSVYWENQTPHIKKPKTAAGVRTVPLLAPLIKALPKRWSGYLFSEDGGKTPLGDARFQTLMLKYQRETGVTASAHMIRHSYATILYEMGVDLKDAQYWLGHSTAAMTQDIYTHLRADQRKRAADELRKKIV